MTFCMALHHNSHDSHHNALQWRLTGAIETFEVYKNVSGHLKAHNSGEKTHGCHRGLWRWREFCSPPSLACPAPWSTRWSPHADIDSDQDVDVDKKKKRCWWWWRGWWRGPGWWQDSPVQDCFESSNVAQAARRQVGPPLKKKIITLFV